MTTNTKDCVYTDGMTTTTYTQEALTELIAGCVAYTIVKTEVATMRGQQKHIIQQDREGVYKPRTRAEFKLTNITFCGIELNEFNEKMAAETARLWVPLNRYYNMTSNTKTCAIFELQEDFVSYNAEQLFNLLKPQNFQDDIQLAEQVIAQMENHMTTKAGK